MSSRYLMVTELLFGVILKNSVGDTQWGQRIMNGINTAELYT